MAEVSVARSARPYQTECPSTREMPFRTVPGISLFSRGRKPLTKVAMIASNTRELIVQLNRGNADRSRAVARSPVGAGPATEVLCWRTYCRHIVHLISRVAAAPNV